MPTEWEAHSRQGQGMFKDALKMTGEGSRLPRPGTASPLPRELDNQVSEPKFCEMKGTKNLGWKALLILNEEAWNWTEV